jgi:hypothetical protein
MFESNVDRRSFLRGSALFAAAVGLTVVAPVAAQEQDKKPEEKKDPFANDEGKKSTRRSSSTKTDANTASARSAPTTCTSRAACGCVRTAATATWNKTPSAARG